MQSPEGLLAWPGGHDTIGTSIAFLLSRIVFPIIPVLLLLLTSVAAVSIVVVEITSVDLSSFSWEVTSPDAASIPGYSFKGGGPWGSNSGIGPMPGKKISAPWSFSCCSIISVVSFRSSNPRSSSLGASLVKIQHSPRILPLFTWTFWQVFRSANTTATHKHVRNLNHIFNESGFIIITTSGSGRLWENTNFFSLLFSC